MSRYGPGNTTPAGYIGWSGSLFSYVCTCTDAWMYYDLYLTKWKEVPEVKTPSLSDTVTLTTELFKLELGPAAFAETTPFIAER